MTARLPPTQISDSFIAACLTEVRALKPGNVHTYAAGHGMQVADFEASARVSAPHISNVKSRVGERILRAVEATMATVGCNTNLGILLLCAPLAVAAEKRAQGDHLRTHLREVLAGLDPSDAANVFRAIATANPGGLGDHESADVRVAPPASTTLLEAMQAARHRDLIAEEYVTDFARVFALHAHEYKPRLAEGWTAENAIAGVYLSALSSIPDTHIARKFGAAVAQRVMERAHDFQAKHAANSIIRSNTPEMHQHMLDFDTELKAEGLNPGSLADIMAAILFVSELELSASTP